MRLATARPRSMGQFTLFVCLTALLVSAWNSPAPASEERHGPRRAKVEAFDEAVQAAISPLSVLTISSTALEAPVAQAAAEGDSTTPTFGPRRSPFSDLVARTAFVPIITVTKIDQIIGDDGDGLADPGETIRYTVTIINLFPPNKGGEGAGSRVQDDATSVVFTDTIDPNTTLVPGSENASPLAFDATATASGSTVTIPLTGADPDGDPLTFSIVSPPSQGTLGPIVPTSPTTATVDYTPPASPTGPTDPFTFVVNDGTLNANEDATVVVSLNQPPVLANIEAAALGYTEGDPATPITATITVSDPDNTTLQSAQIQITGNYQNGEDLLSDDGSVPAGITVGTFDTVNGSLMLTGAASLADYQTALRAITYENTSSTPSTLTRTVSFTVNDGIDNSNTVTRDVTVTPVNNLNAVGDSYTGVGNTQLEVNAAGTQANAPSVVVTGTVLDNDDNGGDGPGPVTVDASSVGTSATTQGGSVTLNAAGEFVYTPPAALTGASADDFAYTITDDGGTTTAAATVTLTLSSLVWYIDNNVSGGSNDGRSNSPFETLSAFNTANTGGAGNPDTGDQLFVHQGSGAYDSGITLLDDQVLTGEESGLTVGPLTIPAGTAPTLINTGGDGIALAQNNTVRGLDVGNTTGAGFAGTTVGTLTVSAVAINGSGAAVDLDGGTMAVTFEAITSTTTTGGDPGIDLNNVSGTFAVTGATTLDDSGGDGIDLSNSGATFSFNALSIGQTTGPGGDSINLDTNTGSFTVTGTTTVNNATGPSIDITGTAGGGMITFAGVDIDNRGNAGIDITGGNHTISFGATTVDNQNSVTDDGIAIDNTTGGSITFSSVAVDINNAAAPGVNLQANAAVIDMQGAGSSIQGATPAAFRVNGGTGNVTYAGTITNTAGRSALVQNRMGGTVTFNGAMDDDGTGIFLDNNTGSTITFTGGLTLDTGANTAFTATNGGTVNVTGTNTIGSNTALSTTAVNIVNTTIGASGVTFQSVSVNGATAVGINIDNAGTTGFFTVTGTGTTDGSGGTIQNTTQNGILIQNTDNITLSNMNLTNAADEAGAGCTSTSFGTCTASLEFNTVSDVSITNMTMSGSDEHGLFGQGVTNLDISNSSFATLGNGTDENAIFLVNLLGTTAAGTNNVFDNVTITSAADNGIQINNSTSTNPGNTSSPDYLTVQNSTINGSGVGGIQAITDTGGTGNLQLDVTSTNFSSNAAVGIATNSNGGDLQTNITTNMILHGTGNQFQGLSGGATSTGSLFFTVTGNTITANNGGAGTGPSGIAYANIGSGNMNGTIGGAGGLANTVTNNTPAGVTSVSGISVINNGAGSSFVTLNNNNVTIVGDGFGIIANAQGANSGSADFHILSNTVNVNGSNIANSGISLTNSSSNTATECVNISSNTVATSPAGNVDILIENSASGTFQVQQTAVTTNPPYNFTPNDPGVELDIQGAQTSTPGGTIVNPFAAGSFTPGTCVLPTAPAMMARNIGHVTFPVPEPVNLGESINSRRVLGIAAVEPQQLEPVTTLGESLPQQRLRHRGETVGQDKAIPLQRMTVAALADMPAGVDAGEPLRLQSGVSPPERAGSEIALHDLSERSTLDERPRATLPLAALAALERPLPVDSAPDQSPAVAAATEPVRQQPASRSRRAAPEPEPVLLASSADDAATIAGLLKTPDAGIALPTTEDLKRAFSMRRMACTGSTCTWNIGDLPEGRSVTISFDVTVNDPFPVGIPEISNQGTLTADDGQGGTVTVLSDDPDTPQIPDDPTITLVDNPAKVVINEVDYIQPPSANADAAEFIELKNTGTVDVDLSQLDLVLVDGAATPAVYQTIPLSGTLLVGGYFVICSDAATVTDCDLDTTPDTDLIQNGAPDAVALQTNTGTPVFVHDAVSYDGVTGAPYNEGGAGAPADPATGGVPGPDEDKGIARIDLGGQDGIDTDDNAADFSVRCITPGAANTLRDTSCAQPIFDVTKVDALQIDTDGNGQANPGDVLRYTIAVTNTGGLGLNSLFTDTPDANTALVVGSVTTTQGTVTRGNTGGDTDVEVDLGTVNNSGTPPDAVITFDVTVGVLPAGINTVANQGALAASNLPAGPVLTDDPDDPTSNADPTVTPVSAASMLAATKVDAVVIDTDNDGQADPGETIRYTIVLTNNGGRGASTVVFSDTPDANTALVVGSVTTTAGTVTQGNTGGDTAVEVSVPMISGGGGQVTITFDVTVNVPFPSAVPQVANQGTITAANDPGTVTDDPDTPAAPDATLTPIDVQADLSLTKTADDVTPDFGRDVTFELILVNDGPSQAGGTITDVLPSGLTYVSDDGQGAYNPSTGAWTVPVLMVGGRDTLRIVSTVETIAPVTNTAEVTSASLPDPDSTPDDGQGDDYAAVTITPVATDLSVSKRVVDFSGDRGGPGPEDDTVSAMFEVIVTNAGPSAATGVVVTDPVPEGATLVAAAPSQGAYDPTTSLWTVGALDLDAEATLVVTLTASASNNLFNLAEVTGDQPDQDLRNNLAGAAGQHGPHDPTRFKADLSLEKSVDNEAPLQGTEVTYTIAITNDGPSTTDGVVVSDQLPQGLEFVSATTTTTAGACDDCTYDDEEGRWYAGHIPVGATKRLHLVALVVGTGEITNTAEIVESHLPDIDSVLGDGNEDEDDQDSAVLVATSGANAAAIREEGGTGEKPSVVELGSGYPNPFNPEIVIPFGVPEATEVRVEVYNLLGRRVAVLVEKAMEAGRHEVRWRAEGLPTGLYLVRMRAGSAQRVQRITLVR